MIGRCFRKEAFQTGEEVIHGEAKREQVEKPQAGDSPENLPGRERGD
jgi:hypothetical protein